MNYEIKTRKTDGVHYGDVLKNGKIVYSHNSSNYKSLITTLTSNIQHQMRGDELEQASFENQ